MPKRMKKQRQNFKEFGQVLERALKTILVPKVVPKRWYFLCFGDECEKDDSTKTLIFTLQNGHWQAPWQPAVKPLVCQGVAPRPQLPGQAHHSQTFLEWDQWHADTNMTCECLFFCVLQSSSFPSTLTQDAQFSSDPRLCPCATTEHQQRNVHTILFLLVYDIHRANICTHKK